MSSVSFSRVPGFCLRSQAENWHVLHVLPLGEQPKVWHVSDFFTGLRTDEGLPPALPTGPLTSFGFGPDLEPRVYYVGTDSDVYELARLGQKWNVRDLTTEKVTPPDVKPPAARLDTAPTGFGVTE
jgi:hypothetical protein